MEGAPKIASASPGGNRATSAKKRRLEALERNAAGSSKQAKATQQKTKNKERAAKPESLPPQSSQLSSGRPNTYEPLDNSIWQGPVGLGLKIPMEREISVPKDSTFTRYLPLHLSSQAEISQDKALADIGGQLDANEMLTFPKQTKGNPAANLQPHLMSGRALKNAGLQLQRAELTSANVAILHGLWREYASKLVHANMGASRLNRVLEEQLDFHGCPLTIVRAADPRHVGATGVVVRNTATAVTLALTGPQSEHSAENAPLRRAVMPKAGLLVELRYPMPAGEAIIRLSGAALRVPRR